MNINFKIPDIEIISEKQCIELGMQQSSRFSIKHAESFISKVEEYVLMLGLHSPNMYPIFISLLVEGKVKIQFKNYIERLILTDPQENMNIRKAFEIFEKTKDVIEWRINHPNDYNSSEKTQRIVIQTS